MEYRLAGTSVNINLELIPRSEVPPPDLEQVLTRPKGEVFLALVRTPHSLIQQIFLAPIPDRELFSLVQAILAVEPESSAVWYVIESADLMEQIAKAYDPTAS